MKVTNSIEEPNEDLFSGTRTETKSGCRWRSRVAVVSHLCSCTVGEGGRGKERLSFRIFSLHTMGDVINIIESCSMEDFFCAAWFLPLVWVCK